MKLPLEYIESLKKVSNLNIEKLEQSFDMEKIVGIRFNSQKFFSNSTEDYEDFLKQSNINCKLHKIPWCKTGFYIETEDKPGKNILHELGAYYLQEPSAMAPVEFMGIDKNDFVLDLCASPGGKTTQIAEKLTNGHLVSNEIVPSRAKILQENVERLGFGNVTITNHSPKDLEKFFDECFDKILVDAPCSGEGMFRKNNDAILEWNKDTPLQCAARQKEIVSSAYKMLKPNGIMAYSTCTFSLEENEEIVKFLVENFGMEVLPVEHEKYNFENGIEIGGKSELNNCARLYPYNINGEGHFFAILKKSGENEQKTPKNIKNYQKNIKNIDIFKNFQKEYLSKQFDNFVLIGDYLYANAVISIDKLKVLQTGVLLGEIKKNVFVPSYHLAHCLKPDEFAQVLELSHDDAKKYIEGNTLCHAIKNGWVLLTHKNIPLSFGKCVDGTIKNHYPKVLRKSNI